MRPLPRTFVLRQSSLGWIDVVDRKVLMIARQRQRADLEESEIGGLFSRGAGGRRIRSPRDCPSASSPARTSNSRIGARGNMPMLQHGREGHHARAGTAQPVVDGLIVGGIGGADRVQRAILLGDIEAEARFAQMTRPVREERRRVREPRTPFACWRECLPPTKTAAGSWDSADRSVRHLPPSTTVRPRPSATAAMPSSKFMGGTG